MKRPIFALFLLMALPLFSIGQTFTITASDESHLSLHFVLDAFSIDTVSIDGELMHSIATRGIVAPNEYGQPDVPTFSRFVAIPQGARAIVEVRTSRGECLSGINLRPAVGSQCENDPSLPFYKDPVCYNTNALFPDKTFSVAEPQQLRGVDVIHLGLCPVQYNPATRELVVHLNLDIDIRFEGGNGHFGDDRLRSPYWDPILRNNILNFDCLPSIDYEARMQCWSQSRPMGCEYLIVTPDDDVYYNSVQELADYRRRQGIVTQVMRITEIGTDQSSIRQGFRNIYNNWDIPPVAVCLVGECNEDTQTNVPGYWTPHPKDNYIYSDNPYADVNDDELPDMCFTRIIAQSYEDLSLLIDKQIDYEYTNPVMDEYYYGHPLTAAGWQNDKWFMISIATVSGFLTQHGKIPSRINEIYAGDLGHDWSTAPGTDALVSYFGPDGLGYIPATPAELGGWTGGNAQQVIDAINNGCYLIQHRDHGWNHKWYQPNILVSDFDGIQNADKMSYLISVNCRTGQYYTSETCFLEGLLRMTRSGHKAGIVGAIAPAAQTYSYANDIYLYGLWDLLDSSFLPDYGPFATHADTWMPSFANVAGKYFLEMQVFPSTNESMRSCTYVTFHTHGDPFLRFFTEVPQPIVAQHDPSFSCFVPFHVTAPEGSQIALTTVEEGHVKILATATGTGEEQTINIPEYVFGDAIHLTITGLNLLRLEEDIPIDPYGQPLVVVDSLAVNNGGLTLHYGETVTADIHLTNVGLNPSEAGSVVLSSDSEFIDIIQGEMPIGALAGGASMFLEDAFRFDISDAVPDMTRIPITITTHFGYGSHERSYEFAIESPHLAVQLINIDDATGNGDHHLDPGEYATLTFRISNEGHYIAENPTIALNNDEGYVRIITPEVILDDIPVGTFTEVSFDLFVEYIAGESPYIHLTLQASTNGLIEDLEYACPVGFVEESFENGYFEPGFWTNDPDHPWTIDNTIAYHGDYSAKSGTITHEETTLLSFTYTSDDIGYFSFYTKVSTENNWDWLSFFIDGIEEGSWSGEHTWAEHSFRVLPGRHTYTWRYTKDNSVNGGMDAVWIDYLMLPYHLDETAEQADLPLDIHPNPTTNQVTLDLEQEGDFTVQVYDANGRLVLSEQNSKVVSFKNRPAGMYHIVVEQNGVRRSRKIIKM